MALGILSELTDEASHLYSRRRENKFGLKYTVFWASAVICRQIVIPHTEAGWPLGRLRKCSS